MVRVTGSNVNQNAVLAQPANMTVNEGARANQSLTATDADGQALTFTKAAGPTYATVTTTTPGTGTGTGNLALAPGFSDSGTATVSVSVSDGAGGTDSKSLTVTVNNVDRPVSLAAINNMTVTAGSTADQTFTATDPDGDAITFTHTGPTFMTRTDNVQSGTTRTGNIHLAPVGGTSGTFAASVTATSLATNDTKSFTITVQAVNRAPVLAQPANMTVNEGQVANQTITATDPDGNPLTFSKVSGPAYVTVTTTTQGTGTATGNIALAPGFSDAGTATASVSATDGSLSDGKSFTITVNNVNQNPVLAQPANMTVNEGATANQTLTATEADGEALTFTKAAGPTYATVTTTTPGTGTGTGNLALAPGFSDSGTATVSISVSDGAGGTDSKSLTVTVNNVNRNPVLAQPTNMTVNEGATANQTLTATDADGDALSFTKAAGPTYATVTTTTPGTGTGTGNLALAPGFSDSGTATVSVSVSDGAGGTDSKSLTVTVNNVDRPVSLAAINSMTVAAGSTADQTFTATDPDGDAITFTHTGPTFMTRTDNVQSGTTRTGNIHLAPVGGTSGTFAASVTATSLATNDTKSFTITVQAVNRAPVLAQPANMTVNEGQVANQTITATDPDGNPLTFSKVSGPAYMTVTTTTQGTGTATGNIALAPGFSDAGTATASVSATDGSLSDGKSFTITVNNVNQNPVLAQPANMTVNEGATANQTLTATDADGQALTFTKAAGPTYATVTTTTPGTGTGTGNLALAPGFSDSGTATVSISVSDGAGGTDSKSLTVTVNNVDRPVSLAAINNMTVAAGSTADQTFTATDPDGDAITFTHTGPTFMTRTDNVQSGTTRTGNIHLAPVGGTSGTFAASVTATSLATNDTKSFTITVQAVNRAPVLAQPANMTVNEGQVANQTITATDPDGNPLTFSKVSGPAYVTVTTTTQGTGTATGNIALAPGFSDAGTATASVSATDGSLSDGKSFTITVNNVNQNPVLAQPANMTVNEGQTANQTLTATDADGQALTFTKAAGPTYATVTTTTPGTGTGTGNLALAPGFSDSGTATVSISVSDGAGGTDSKSLTVTVNNVDRPVSLAAINNMTVVAGSTADQTFTATDPDGDAITFTNTGPTFMTRTDNAQAGTTRTGNIHLAPSSTTSGTFSASVTARSEE